VLSLRQPGCEAMEGAPAAQMRPAAAAATPTKLQHVVIDSGAVIHGGAAGLVHSAENFWTVSAVIAEIRDKKARHYLDTLPYEIKLREPSEEAMAFAVGFARKTGDLRSLSRVDLSVIALTYQLEKEVTGAAHINAEPTMQRVQQQQAKPKPAAAAAAAAPAGASASTQQPQSTAAPAVAVPDSSAASDGACTSGPATDDDNAAHASAAQTDAAVVHDEQQSDAHSEHSASDADDNIDANSDDGADEDYSGADSDAESDSAHHVRFDTAATASAASAAADFSIADDDFPSLGSANLVEEADDSVDTEQPQQQQQQQQQQQKQQQQPAVKSAWAATAIAHKDGPFKPSARQQVTRTANTVPVADAQADSTSASDAAAVAAERKQQQQQQQQRGTNSSRILNATSNTGITSNGFDEDDGIGWVSPENYAEQKALGIGLNGPSQQIVSAASTTAAAAGDAAAAGAGGADEFKPAKKGKKGRKQSAAKQLRLDNAAKCRAGCVTTDFAMQNVLLQMGLPLLSVNGMTVNRVKQWILRCAACFKTTTDMSKLFCPICGNSTLEKVSCSVDATTGVTRLHLRKNYKTNLRGTKFSLPKPGTAGRFKGDLLLREDQLLTGIWAQKAKRSVKSVGSMFGEHITENVGLTINKAPDLVVGYGRKNPNSQRGRERRGKKVSR
jgi:RNA-binding protein NOB1